MDSKSIFLSKTFWGLVIGILAPILAKHGIVLPGDDSGVIDQIVGFIGDGLALYGRFTATQPLHVVAPSQPGGPS